MTVANGPNLATAILQRLESAPAALEFFFHGGAGGERLSAGDMTRRIAGFAASLGEEGIAPRTVVPIVAGSSAALWAAFVGAMAADLIPCIMAAPTFKTHMPTYARNITSLMARYGSRTLVIEAAYHSRLTEVLAGLSTNVALLDLEALARPASALPAPSPGGEAVAFLQHSSGSTGTPRGVALSHAAVIGHLSAYARTVGLDPAGDRIASWLPLYHDMGLLTSFLLPLVYGISCDTIPAQDWILDPVRILTLMTERRSTLSWWPNFTYALLAQRARPGQGLDLRSVRMLVNCSEPVLPISRDRFLAAYAGAGLAPSALQTCYAMAENVFAVSQSAGNGPATLTARRDSLAEGEVVDAYPAGANARSVMSSGRLMESVGLRVVDGERRPCPEGRVGEIAISGPSLFSGYHLLPEATAPVLQDGWYFTGDVGFVRDGEVFVLGRRSDLIIVGGRKFYPNDLEHVVNEIEGVKEGRVVAFGVRSEDKGTEEVVVLVESLSHEDRAAVQRIKKEIKARVLQRTDCAVDYCRVLAPQSLIKTTSGKIARRDNLRFYIEKLQPKA